MEPIQYVRIVKRRWFVVVVLAVLGVAAGWATTPSAALEPEEPLFVASHVLVAGEGAGDLPRLAYLTTAGDVPARAAAALEHPDPVALANRVTVVAHSGLRTLEIISVQSTPEAAEELVDAFAAALQGQLLDRQRFERSVAADEALEAIDSLSEEIEQLDAQLAANDDPITRATRDAAVNRYRVAYEQFQNLAALGEPTTGLTSLEPASAVPTSRGALRSRLDELRASANQRGNRTLTVQTFQGRDPEGEPPPELEEPVGAPTRAGVGGLAGLLVGIGAVLLLDRMDTRVRTSRGVEAIYGVPVLAEVARLPRRRRNANEVVLLTEPTGPAADAYRRLRSAVMFEHLPTPILDSEEMTGLPTGNGHGARRAARSPSVNRRARVVLVTSATVAEGKSTVAANLAAAFAETGARVLAIDCDYRRPHLPHFLRFPLGDHAWAHGLERHASLAAAHAATTPDAGEVTLDDVAGPSVVPGVWALQLNDGVQAPTNPTQLFTHLRRILDQARDLADVIVLDTAPQLAVSDVNDLLPEADLVVLVARSGHTRQDHAHRVSELLTRAGAPLLGVVLVGAETSSASRVYFSGYNGSRRRRKRLQPVLDTEGLPAQFSDFANTAPGPSQPLWTHPEPPATHEFDSANHREAEPADEAPEPADEAPEPADEAPEPADEAPEPDEPTPKAASSSSRRTRRKASRPETRRE